MQEEERKKRLKTDLKEHERSERNDVNKKLMS